MAVVGYQSVIVFTFVLALYVLVSLWIFHKIYKVQSKPYMDETFHIPQAQKYCEGNFSVWDPKITTPPGLYLISVGILVPFSKLLGVNLCNVFFLRMTNLLFSVGNFYLLFVLVCKIQHKGTTGNKLVFSALNLAFFPVMYFFTFLYYTDTGSLFFVLLMYLFHLYHFDWTAALFGAISVLFRQTNIVWVFFVAAQESIAILSRYIKPEKKDDDKSTAKGSTQYLIFFFSTAAGMPFRQKKRFLNALVDILCAVGGYLLVGIAFFAFFIYNHSLALGDKDAHQPCLNIPQLGYFLGFTLFFANPYLITISKIRKFFQFVINQPMLICIICLLSALAIQYLTYIHPYLLADNRHLNFYIWKRLLGRSTLVSCLMIPAYVYSGWAVVNSLHQKDALWKLVFSVCVVLSIVPQRLLEFRYAIVPFVLFRLHILTNTYLQLLIEFMLFFSVNSFTVYLFLEKPFISENEVQRFIW